jgi:hypothetical protein
LEFLQSKGDLTKMKKLQKVASHKKGEAERNLEKAHEKQIESLKAFHSALSAFVKEAEEKRQPAGKK